MVPPTCAKEQGENQFQLSRLSAWDLRPLRVPGGIGLEDASVRGPARVLEETKTRRPPEPKAIEKLCRQGRSHIRTGRHGACVRAWVRGVHGTDPSFVA